MSRKQAKRAAFYALKKWVRQAVPWTIGRLIEPGDAYRAELLTVEEFEREYARRTTRIDDGQVVTMIGPKGFFDELDRHPMILEERVRRGLV